MSNMPEITKDDVVLYLERHVTDPAKIARIEQAREDDPRVTELFLEVQREFAPAPDVRESILDTYRQAIRRRPGDPGRKKQITDIAAMLASFQAKAGTLSPTPASALDFFGAPQKADWTCPATANRLAGLKEGPPQPAEESTQYISINGDDVVMQAPSDKVPYGIVRLFAQEGDTLVGLGLLTLKSYGELSTGAVPARTVVGNQNPKSLTWKAEPANTDTLPLFSSEELVHLRDCPGIEHQIDVQQLEELITLVTQHEAKE